MKHVIVEQDNELYESDEFFVIRLVKELTGKEGKIGETKINISKGGLGINKERFENGIELARKDKNEEAAKA